MPTRTCTACNGRGGEYEYYKDAEGKTQMRWKRCGSCGGNGYINTVD